MKIRSGAEQIGDWQQLYPRITVRRVALQHKTYTLFSSPLTRTISGKAVEFVRSALIWVPFGLWITLTSRLLIAISRGGADLWPELVFATGCFTVGLVFKQCAIVAWFFAIPFIVTCAFFGLLPIAEPIVLSFCCLSLGTLLRRVSFRSTEKLPRHVLWLDGLATWIAIGLAFHWHEVGGISAALFSQAVFGFDAPYFLVTGTHLWLTAWFLYRQCLSHGRQIFENTSFLRKSLERPTDPSTCFPWLLGWIGIGTGVIGIAWMVQRHFRFPDLAGYGEFIAFAPFEDLHAFGSVVGALLVGALCCVNANRWRWLAVIIVVGAIILVALSYSRASWLWVGLGTIMVICLRCKRNISVALIIVSFGLLATLYWIAPRLRALDNPYADRVAALVRVDQWTQYDSIRIGYYKRSIGMIQDRPWFGCGTGTSRRITGDFIHNFLLQTATESGLPAMGFFLMGLVGALLPALQALRRMVSSIETKTLLVATVTYLGTQLTANAINIYPTQVFFFWPLLAMLYLSAKRDLRSILDTPK